MNTPPYLQISWLLCSDGGRLVSYCRFTSNGSESLYSGIVLRIFTVLTRQGA